MAIDTDNEKLAIMTFQRTASPALPTSTDGLGQADNQHMLWGYPGILWEVKVEVYGQASIDHLISIFNEDRSINVDSENRIVNVF